jgi:hypothetical protein
LTRLAQPEGDARESFVDDGNLQLAAGSFERLNVVAGGGGVSLDVGTRHLRAMHSQVVIQPGGRITGRGPVLWVVVGPA